MEKDRQFRICAYFKMLFNYQRALPGLNLTTAKRFSSTGPRISGGWLRELARVNACPLHTLDGRRAAPNSQWMAIRGPDDAARSVRTITSITGVFRRATKERREKHPC